MKKLSLVFLLLLLMMVPTFADNAAAPDPIRLSVGSRTLGMGKAMVGLADDLGSVYVNPAGVANVEKWQLTSLSGKLLDEFNYVSLAGVYPTNFGKVGLAFAGSSIGGAIPTRVKAGSDPDDPVYEADPTQELMNYYNNVFILTYADKMGRLLSAGWAKPVTDRAPWLKDINFGVNLKLFSVGLSGDGITQGSANGQELDFGLQARPTRFLSVGANMQNLLPFSMGGKLRYASGWEESYPAVLKTGLALSVIGPPESALREIGDHRVNVLLDADWEPTRSQNVPILFHLGTEWMPMELLAVRLGIDQEQVGVGTTANNLTAGVGVFFRGFRFDYAYHQFAGAPGVDNHFFSLSYGIFPPKKKWVEKVVITPATLITTESRVIIRGIVQTYDVATVRVSGEAVKLTKQNAFEIEVPILASGKNTIWVEAFDSRGNLIETDRVRVIKLNTYPDVPADYWAAEQVSYIGTLGIIKGYPDGRFKPEGNITRAEMSALLMRTKASGEANIPTPTVQLFKDVPLKHWAVKYVNQAARVGIVKGYPDGGFKPNANINRAEGLAMVGRFGGVREIAFNREFTDVKPNFWAAPIIAGAYKEGLLQYFANKPFQVGKKLNRAESVEILFRSSPVKGLIAEFTDFEKGFETKSPVQLENEAKAQSKKK